MFVEFNSEIKGMGMFFGRSNERLLLEEKYASAKSELLVVYGRRRIGKTALIKKFIENKTHVFAVEGIEGERSNYQILQFARKAISHVGDRFMRANSLDNWDLAFSYLTEKIISGKRRRKKIILFFDELQWMAAGRGRLIAIIKNFWDDSWKDANVMLILCGSIASFMVKKVIRSKALYGRISTELLLKGLRPDEAAKIFKGKRSKEEVLKYQLVLGGVPKYLEEINLDRSFNQNMNSLFFSSNSFMMNEIEKIFYNQFKAPKSYIRIINLLNSNMLGLDGIASALNRKSGGSLREALQLLESAELIKSYISFERGWNTKFRKYRISDEYLTFFFKFVSPHMGVISENAQKNLFEIITKDNFDVWLGFAFERFCLKHAFYLAGKMGFLDRIISHGPFFSRGDNAFQIDLIYKRVDNVITVCEIKHRSRETGTGVIPEMERKLSLLEIPRGFSVEKALISLYGPDSHLKKSGYFNHYVTLDDIMP